jgi:copper transport protein
MASAASRGVTPIALIAGVLLWLGLAVASAHAHATLVASEPADGAVVAAAPARLTLTFNEPVSPLVLRLVRSDGRSEVLQARSGRDASIVVPVPSGLPQGTHVLSWRVVSLDGHPVGGSVVFSVGAPSVGVPGGAASETDRAVSVALWLCKLVFYLGAFIGIGGAFFLAWLTPAPLARAAPALRAALAVALVAMPLAVGLQGADALGAPLAGLASRAVWLTGLETSFGLTAIVAQLALLAGLLALHAPARRLARALALSAFLAIGLALALSGHAGAAAPQWLTRPAVFGHALAVAFWIGTLIPLAVALRGGEGGAVLAAFSRAIPFAVAPLIVSGGILAIVQVQEPALLLATAYGRLLAAKLALVALLLGLAAWNRFRLTPAIAAGAVRPRAQLRRMIAIELAIVAAILALVASWRFTPPPRALAIAAAKPALVHIHTAQAMADVTFAPGHAGEVAARIVIMTGDFGPLDAREVEVTLENKPAGIEPIVRRATKGADAVWRVEKLPIPQNGRWTVSLDILVNDFEKVQLDGTIDIGAPE